MLYSSIGGHARVDFKEGEEVVLPCRHCSSVSLQWVVVRGTKALACAKCRGITSVTLEHSVGGWTIRTHAEAPTET